MNGLFVISALIALWLCSAPDGGESSHPKGFQVTMTRTVDA